MSKRVLTSPRLVESRKTSHPMSSKCLYRSGLRTTQHRFAPSETWADVFDFPSSTKRITPRSFQKVEFQESDSQINRVMNAIERQQAARKIMEDSLIACEEVHGFRSTLLKSNELLSVFLNENLSKYSVIHKFIDVELDLFKNLKKNIEMIKKFKENFRQAQSVQEELEKLKIKCFEQEKTIEALRGKQRFQHKTKDTDGFLIKQRAWAKERADLEIKVEELSKELSHIKALEQDYNNFKSSPNQNLLMLKEFEQKKFELRNMINRLQFELGIAKENLLEKEKTIEDLNEKINVTNNQIFAREKADLINTYTERIRMQLEEIIALIPYKETTLVQEDKIKKLTESIVYYEEAEKLAAARNSIKFENMINLNDPIFSVFIGKKLKFENIASQSYDYRYYKLSKPSFAGFLQIPQNYQYRPIFNLWLEMTIRAVLDSKFAEHLLVDMDSIALPSSLPDFLFEWIGQFYVDENSRTINEIEWWKKEYADENKMMILAALSENQIQSKKIWEIYTFKEMLSEDISVDELHFYLYCRNLIFQGPQLAHHQGKFCQFHYVQLSVVLSVIVKMMDNIQEDSMKELKCMLESRSKKVDYEAVIESSFALRVLLEYYRKEKLHKINSMFNLYNNYIKEESKICFKSFKEVLCLIDKNITDGELAKTYRFAYTVGNGRISFESLIISLNENGVFYRYMRKKETKSTTEDSSSYEHRKLAIKQWNSTMQEISFMKEPVINLGVPRLVSKIKSFENMLKDTNEFLDISDKITRFWMIIIKVIVTIGDIGIIPPGNKVKFECSEELKDIFEAFKLKKLQSIRENRAARTIQMWVRREKDQSEPVASIAKKLKRKRTKKNKV